MQTVKNIISKWNSISLVKRIICGLIIGIILGLVVPQASGISILGDLFVGALRGIAPVLVFFLVMSSLCHMGKGQKTNMKVIVILYMAGNILAAACAVAASYIFPITLTFTENTDTSDVAPPSGVTEVLTNLLMNLVDNPVNAIPGKCHHSGKLHRYPVLGYHLWCCSERGRRRNQKCAGAYL